MEKLKLSALYSFALCAKGSTEDQSKIGSYGHGRKVLSFAQMSV